MQKFIRSLKILAWARQKEEKQMRGSRFVEMKTVNNSLGIGIGLTLWGLCFIIYPAYVGITGWIYWTMSLVGFLLLLIGMMGACVDLFQKDEGTRIYRKEEEDKRGGL